VAEKSASKRPAAFLDRDGTLIVEHGYLGEPELVEPLPGAIDAVRMLNDWGYRVIGVSNQSGIARGYYDSATVDRVNARVIESFAGGGARIDRIYYCAHLPLGSGVPGEAECECRKPKAGMIEWAEQDFDIDRNRSFVCGDQPADIGLSKTIGVPGCLVRTGFGRSSETELRNTLRPDHVADDLPAAVRWWGARQGYAIH